MGSFEKSLVLLQASHSTKCNIISNRTCLSIHKHSLVPKVCSQNISSIKTDFEDFKSSFIETLNVQTELFMNQQKELLFTEMNSFKNELLTSHKHSTKSHSHEPSNNTDRIILLISNRISAGTTKIQRQNYKFPHRKYFQKRQCIFFAKGRNNKNS